MKTRTAAIAVALVAAALLLTCCSRIVVDRKYDATGIISERGTAWGVFDEQASRFNMSRRDQKGPSEMIEETAGADASWTHNSGRAIAADFSAWLNQMFALYSATHGIPTPSIPTFPTPSPAPTNPNALAIPPAAKWSGELN